MSRVKQLDLRILGGRLGITLSAEVDFLDGPRLFLVLGEAPLFKEVLLVVLFKLLVLDFLTSFC